MWSGAPSAGAQLSGFVSKKHLRCESMVCGRGLDACGVGACLGHHFWPFSVRLTQPLGLLHTPWGAITRQGGLLYAAAEGAGRAHQLSICACGVMILCEAVFSSHAHFMRLQS